MKYRILSLVALLLGSASWGQAQQFDLSVNPINITHGDGDKAQPDSTSGQFVGVAGISATAVVNDPDVGEENSTKETKDVTVSNGSHILVRSFFGGSFSGAVPDYFMGDEIPVPEDLSFDHDQDPGTSDVNITFRAQPVLPGESFKQFDLPGGANPTASDFALPGNYQERFYYSKHADAVFASHPGSITVFWRSENRVAEIDGENAYYVLEETYSVSAGSLKKTQKIYWTEHGFGGPKVQIPRGRVTGRCEVIYNDQVPEEVPEGEEYDPPGVGIFEVTRRTLWFQEPSGAIDGALQAYNREGRLLVEFLGNSQGLGDSSIRHHLGMEVVDIIQETPPVPVELYLGEKARPSDGSAAVGGAGENASPDGKTLFDSDEFTAHFFDFLGGADQYLTNHEVGSQQVYYATQETSFANQAQIYWLQASPTGNLGIEWPAYFNNYQITWPREIDGFFELNARPADDALGDIGPWPLPPETSPELVHQDDAAGFEAKVNAESELEIDFRPGSDDVNRALIRLRSEFDFWYLRVYSYRESNLRNPDEGGPDLSELENALSDARSDLLGAQIALARDPDDPDLLAALGAAQSALFDLSSQIFQIKYQERETVAVGERIDPPAIADSVAGYISAGTAYNPGAYINPVSDVPAAEAGAIIPVNALPENDELTVWWYRKISPPSDNFEPLYIPSYVGRYDVVWPGEAGTSNVPEIILAANAGPGDLSNEQVAGTVYRQNNPDLPGYNPNEEHALKLAGSFYALRDDLAAYNGDELVSSRPYVLIDYAGLDGRPSMRAFRVLREKDDNNDGDVKDPGDITFRYNIVLDGSNAKDLKGPLPLSIIPPPLKGDGESANEEVAGSNVDVALNKPGGILPVGNPSEGQPDLSYYDRFTFEDRKGLKWIYRGPHNPTDHDDGNLQDDPSIGMHFYYYSREEFDYPNNAGVNDAPAANTIVPYLRPYAEGKGPFAVDQTDNHPSSWFDGGNDPKSIAGTPLTVEYVPFWPDDPRLPETYELRLMTITPTAKMVSSGNSLVVVARDGTELHVRIFDFDGNMVVDKLEAELADGDALTALRALADSSSFPNVSNLSAMERMQVIADAASSAAHTLPEMAVSDDFVRRPVVTLNFAETLTLPKKELPQIRGNSSLQILYQQSIGKNVSAQTPSAILHDPTRRKRFFLQAEGDEDIVLTALPPSIAATQFQGKTYFQNLPPHLEERFFFDPLEGPNGALVLEGEFVEELSLDDHLLPNILSGSDAQTLRDLASPADESWNRAIDLLETKLELFVEDAAVPGTYHPDPDASRDIGPGGAAEIHFSDIAVDSYALTAVGDGAGYVTIIQQNGEDTSTTAAGEPVAVKILKVGGDLYRGQVKPIAPENPLGEMVTLRHTADFAGRIHEYEFQWRYSPPDNGLPPALPGQAGAPAWFDLTGSDGNRNVFGGGDQPLLTMSDNYVTMRYRPIADGHPFNVANEDPEDEDFVPWSDWTEPALVEGWIKRVLDGINPFNQRLSDFFNNAVDTDISLVTQAGTRWEGDVALTLDNIDDVGLIEIYETVLNRGISFSIDGAPPTDYAPANDALLLVAGYLADLYQIVGDEAFADAANPMILYDTQSIPLVADTSISQGFDQFFRATATSRFAFEGQVSSLIEEELGLLRGRDDSLAPGVMVRPYYNRFPWNYTRGIDAGEVLYALNYNIWDSQNADADGVIDEYDAARQYPMGHGDAYGHYLMVLKNYYRLLTDPQFSWAPRIEAVNVAGVPVSVDYFDERKFAQAAVSLGRAADQVIGLERRRVFREDSSAGWGHLRDETTFVGKTLSNGDDDNHIDPAWGVDGWAAKGAQGGYFHWVVANSLLPGEDTVNEGIQKIDRGTVLELDELAAQAEKFQRHADEANAFANPLGISSDSLLVDISPSEMAVGKTHYEQIFERAERALGNAYQVFGQARDSTQLLRGLQNQSENFATAVADEERSFTRRLIEIYGTPYAGDIGPGKAYEQGYEGPDLVRFMYIDQPYFFEEDLTVKHEFQIAVSGGFDRTYDPRNPGEIGEFFDPEEPEKPEDRFMPYVVDPHTIAQIATSEMGGRASPGKLQDALIEVLIARSKLHGIISDHEEFRGDWDAELALFRDAISARDKEVSLTSDTRREIIELEKLIAGLESTAAYLDATSEMVELGLNYISITTPHTLFEFLKPIKAAGLIPGISIIAGLKAASAAQQNAGALIGPRTSLKGLELEEKLESIGFGLERKRMVYDLEHAYDAWRDHEADVDNRAAQFVQALNTYQTLVAEGDALQGQRETFRKRAAAITQGYRTRDVAFRTFRTEELEQYQTLLDTASKYTYLAARAYDYETGLLGGEQGQSFIEGIIRSRALGLVGEDGTPQFAGASTGDPGLSGQLVRMQGDWQVVKSRLGFNNPDTNGTTISLRHENFQLPRRAAGAVSEAENGVWKQILEESMVDDLRADPDIAAHALQIEGSHFPVPGIVLEFSTEIADGKNLFGNPLRAGDHTFSPSSFTTKIHSVGVVFEGYNGMDPCLVCPITGPGPVTSDDPNALSATPYVYLLPTGADRMRTPALGEGGQIREWKVHDHAMPLPFNIGDSAYSNVQFWTAAETLTEPFFQPRKHQAFRAVNNPEFFFSEHPEDFTNSRLVGRSVWNTGWKLVIPGKGLLADEEEGIDRFIRSVSDIQLYLKTYSYSGN